MDDFSIYNAEGCSKVAQVDVCPSNLFSVLKECTICFYC